MKKYEGNMKYMENLKKYVENMKEFVRKCEGKMKKYEGNNSEIFPSIEALNIRWDTCPKKYFIKEI